MNLDFEIDRIIRAGVIPSVSLAITKAPHSFEFGPASSRHKIYYEDIADLTAKIKEAMDAEAYLKSLQTVVVENA